MTTIKLKNGSGAPTAGDLVQGEPALDLTNKRLYTENASGTVIEVGTNPTSITTGTITGSGDMAIDTNTLFVDVSANSVGIGTSSLGSGEGKLAVLGSNGTGGNGNTLLAKFGGNSAVQSRALQLTEYSISGINNVGFDFNAPGAGSQAAISFSTLSAERMRVTSAGNVGIGTTNAPYKLVVSNGGASSIEFGPAYSGTSNLVQHFNRSGAAYVDVVNIAAQHRFNIGGSEAMRIDSSGNVLVGKTTSAIATEGVTLGPNGQHYFTNDGDAAIKLNRLASDGEIAQFRKDSVVVGSIGTASGYVSIGTSDTGILFNSGSDSVRPWNTSTNAGRDAAIDLGSSGNRFKDLYLSNAAYLDKVIGHDDTNTYISFIGSDVTQFVQGGAEAMRLNASGDLLLGVSSLTDSAYHLQTDTGGSTGAQINTVSMGRSGSGYPIIGYNCAPTSTVGTYNKHYVDYASWIQFISGRIDTYTTTTTASGTTTGTAGPYLSSGGTSWTSSSDRRLKDNIEGISYGLEAVKLLNPVSYVRNDRDTGATELGFIAQEVDEVVSEVVSVKDDGYYGIDYERLIPVLTKAIQDQQDIIENLKSRIEQLEGAN